MFQDCQAAHGTASNTSGACPLPGTMCSLNRYCLLCYQMLVVLMGTACSVTRYSMQCHQVQVQYYVPVCSTCDGGGVSRLYRRRVLAGDQGPGRKCFQSTSASSTHLAWMAWHCEKRKGSLPPAVCSAVSHCRAVLDDGWVL